MSNVTETLVKHSKHVDRLRDFYSSKTVLITGGFGFKGSWFALLLNELGAKVHTLDIATESTILGSNPDGITHWDADVRSLDQVDAVMTLVAPDVVFHLAAQPIVSTGYEDPQLTFETNVLGTVNLLESIRVLNRPQVSVVNVTTDKVYRDVEKSEPYLETDELRGRDPYSASKSCSELVTFSYQSSFFNRTDSPVVLSSARAGNVIGGGDLSVDRIIPDLARSMRSGEPVEIRNPNSVRPYEHVLDALFAYAILAERQWVDPSLAGSYNIGPLDESIMRTKELVDYFVKLSSATAVYPEQAPQFHETDILKLDSTLFRETFDWSPKLWSKTDILGNTLGWYGRWMNDMGSNREITEDQVKRFLND